MTHLLPNAPVATEAQAEKAARASAISIIIGVIVGIIGAVWLATQPQIAEQAIAAAEAQTPGAGAMVEATMQGTVWFTYALIVVQAVFAFIQWRSPKKWIAFLFLAMLALGLVSVAVSPFAASLSPGTPVTPMWQIALSGAVMVVQILLHVTGLKGIAALDRLQMDAAR
ncbi:hypothetical protein KOAAANKH_03405 [Brevundimonas sp. NIBR10]|uniref:hypothetical protein n=1 Tax=Brevundimonas sp. NIBR10 TaxID=3015997 RepID=UPI0022F1C3DE|nr:hypothetical protein [Brevundimonas sp. NIBR10]WGM48503.1 hypothetical protein KOAAANKH_03405 [Brevundimonas sp. NIBR10]